MSDQQQQYHDDYHQQEQYGVPATRTPLPQHIDNLGLAVDAGSSEMELFPNNGPTQFVRLAEPDDDRNAQQPAQHRHYYGDDTVGYDNTNNFREMMMQDTSGEMAQDNATIVSQRSLANTVDTDDKTMRSCADTVGTDDKTLQIGSLSYKPRPDDPGTKPPTHNHTDTETAPNNNNTSAKGLVRLEAGSLSFPSPPLMQEEEAKLPHRSNGSGEFPPIQKSDSSSSSSSSGNDDQHHSGEWSPAHEDSPTTTQHGGRSKRRSLLIALIVGGIIVVIAIIVAAVMATSTKGDTKVAKNGGNSITGEEWTGTGTSLSPSSMTPSQIIQTVAPTFDELVDEEGGIVLVSSSTNNGNQTGSDIFDLETTFVPSTMSSSTTELNDGFGDELDGEDNDNSVSLAEASPAPSMLRRPRQAPTGLL